jgi:hypothetical protein
MLEKGYQKLDEAPKERTHNGKTYSVLEVYKKDKSSSKTLKLALKAIAFTVATLFIGLIFNCFRERFWQPVIGDKYTWIVEKKKKPAHVDTEIEKENLKINWFSVERDIKNALEDENVDFEKLELIQNSLKSLSPQDIEHYEIKRELKSFEEMMLVLSKKQEGLLKELEGLQPQTAEQINLIKKDLNQLVKFKLNAFVIPKIETVIRKMQYNIDRIKLGLPLS